VEDPTLVERAFDVMLRGALTGIEVEIEKGIMIMIMKGIGSGIEMVIGLESVIDLVTMSRRGKEDMTIHVVMIEQGTFSLQEIEIKSKIWSITSTSGTMNWSGKETMIWIWNKGGNGPGQMVMTKMLTVIEINSQRDRTGKIYYYSCWLVFDFKANDFNL
jgi:hypothetical protein